MNWSRIMLLGLGLWALGVLSPAQAHPRFTIGFNFGVPFYPRPHCHAPYSYYPYGYYTPQTIFIERPILLQPQPTVISKPATALPAQISTQTAPPNKLPQSFTSTTSSASNPYSANNPKVKQLLTLLTHPVETVRSDAIIDLGKLKALQAIDSIAAALAGDQSPVVRDAAARALGLIGSAQSLTALIHAAQADPDRDVRRSARFAAEVIKVNQGIK